VGKFSKEIVNDALNFAKLPPEVRDYIFAGKLYYGAGVELGKHADTIRQYAEHRCGGSEAAAGLVDEAYRIELAIMINDLVSSKQNSKGSLKRAIEIINSQVNHMRDVLAPPDPVQAQQMFIDMFYGTVDAQAQEWVNARKKDHREAYARMIGTMKFSSVEYLRLDEQLTGVSHREEIVELEHSNARLIGVLTGLGAEAAQGREGPVV
jgi:hypothetical protein